MIEIEISQRKVLRLQHLVSDVNGTLAVDGILIEGVAEQIESLKKHLTIHLLTADTHGKQTFINQQLDLTATRIQPGNEAEQKAEYVRRLGAESVVAVGQGANDAAMLNEAALGLCILSPEGTAVETLLAADLLLPDIHTALALLEHPLRIRASLRK